MSPTLTATIDKDLTNVQILLRILSGAYYEPSAELDRIAARIVLGDEDDRRRFSREYDDARGLLQVIKERWPDAIGHILNFSVEVNGPGMRISTYMFRHFRQPAFAVTLACITAAILWSEADRAAAERRRHEGAPS